MVLKKIQKLISRLKNFKIRLEKEFLKTLVLHLAVMFVISMFSLIMFFYVFLPVYTRHNRTIVVPNLHGIVLENIEQFLKERKLRYKIKDENSYSSDYAPNTVLNQDPMPGSKVKANRTIYISLNAKSPPIIMMPNLLHCSIRGANMVLINNGLRVGRVKYISDIAHNAVLKQSYKGKKIRSGNPISKGSKIDLVVGAGLGHRFVQLPDIVGKSKEEAEILLRNIGLQLGSIIYEIIEDKSPNSVFKQFPLAETDVRVGSMVDVWIVDFYEEGGASLTNEKVIRQSDLASFSEQNSIKNDSSENDSLDIKNID